MGAIAVMSLKCARLIVVTLQRVLLSLFVAIVVAISEGFLYIIWQSRRSASKALPGKHRAIAAAKHKKDDGDPGDGPIETADVPEQEAINALRQRR